MAQVKVRENSGLSYHGRGLRTRVLGSSQYLAERPQNLSAKLFVVECAQRGAAMPIYWFEQLAYDGKRLYCPQHPTHALETSTMATERGTFTMICLAGTAAGTPCLNSASWPSRKHMEQELANASTV
jgi:hypothetical protein